MAVVLCVAGARRESAFTLPFFAFSRRRVGLFLSVFSDFFCLTIMRMTSYKGRRFRIL
jgi:hypothetical protein